ncbi:MAG: RagB/SusD family nutrient uptake outer membrane protein [Bacteroidales bacterium]|nr:RagB/SusD family nutrient uptake outer membrane protein [Bacteroidales bacterium]
MKKILIISWISILIFTTGCYDDFVDAKIVGTTLSTAYYEDENLCEQVINAVYDPLGRIETYSRAYWAVGDMASDDTEEGGETGCKDIAQMRDFHRYNITTSNDLLLGFYKVIYQGVARSNDVLTNLTKENINSSFSDAKFKEYRGQAYFLRAHYYFDLVKMFGPVPYYNGVLTTDEYKELKNRVSGDDNSGTLQKRMIMDSVIADLKNAVINLPVKYASENDIGRVTKASAYALLAKAYMYYSGYFNENLFQKGEVAADSAIILGGGVQACLTTKFHDCFVDKAESLFEIQFVASKNKDYTGEGTIRNVFQAPRYVYWRSKKNMNLDSLDAQGNLNLEGNYISYGLNVPREEVVKLYENNSSTGGDYDPRLDMIAKSGDTMYIASPLATMQGQGWYTIATEYSQTGYYNRKTELGEAVGDVQNSGLNYPMIRYSDVALMVAECAFRNGNDAKALEYVNAVRERARKSKVVSIKPVVAGSALTAYNRVYTEGTAPAKLESITLDDIILERRLELLCEGHRFYDLVRLNKADEVLSKIKVDGCGAACNYKPHNKVMPLPYEVLRLHNGNLIQNPGY